MQIAANGVVDTKTFNVVALIFVNDLIYQQNYAGGWWSKHVVSDTWTSTNAPVLPTPPTHTSVANELTSLASLLATVQTQDTSVTAILAQAQQMIKTMQADVAQLTP